MQAEDQNRGATNREDTTSERSFDLLAKGLASGTLTRLHALRSAGASLLGGLLAGSRRGCPPECLPTRFYRISETLVTAPHGSHILNFRCDPGDRVLNAGYQVQGDANFTVERDIVFTETDTTGVVTQRYAFGIWEHNDTPRNVFIEVVCADLGTPH